MLLEVANDRPNDLALEADWARLTARLQELCEERAILEKVRPNDLQARLATSTEADKNRDKLKQWLIGLFWAIVGLVLYAPHSDAWAPYLALWGLGLLVGPVALVVVFFWWLFARRKAEQLDHDYRTTWNKYSQGIWSLGVQIAETGQDLSKIRAQLDGQVQSV
jgi:hypothetical protein